MSLRVLLADESPSIKKAFDLALKDFAVTVQTVHQGTDVLKLYSSFQPDICFLDVLLPKRNGYEACSDIKQTESDTPIILMWSNFLEVDESKFTNCGAVARIEKPFETKTLRSLVLEHVPKTKSNKISSFLTPLQKEKVKTEQPVSTAQKPHEMKDLPPLKKTKTLSAVDIKDGDLSALEHKNLSDNGASLPELPDIDDLFDSPSLNEVNNIFSDSPVQDIDSVENAFENNDSSSNADISLDPFDGLNLQDSNDEQEEEDFENFQMEPLENFETPTEALETPTEAFETPADSSEAHSGETLEPKAPPIFELQTENHANEGTPPPPPSSIQSLDTQAFEIPEVKEHENHSDLEEKTADLKTDLNSEQYSSFQGNDDELTDPSISIVDRPLITPPPPPPALFEPAADLTNDNLTPSETLSEPIPLKTKETGESFTLESELSKEELKRLIMAQSKDIIESVVWEVVPELAKEMIKKEIERLTGEINPNEEPL